RTSSSYTEPGTRRRRRWVRERSSLPAVLTNRRRGVATQRSPPCYVPPTMARTVKGGLIQLANAKFEGSVKEICQAMVEKTLPWVDKAGKAGVQMLCMQEVFNTPYFCPAQTPNWYDAAEAVPGPTTQLMAEYAKKHSMVIVVPLYEREM